MTTLDARTARQDTVVPERARRPRRWPRLAIPFGLLALVWIMILTVHAVEEPDLAEPGTLSPTGTGGDGSSQLAARLAERGVTVRRVTTSAAARDLVTGAPPTTVFVPTPNLVDPRFLHDLTGSRHRVVLVRPGFRSALLVGMVTGQSRWATRTARPGCDAEVAISAGEAAVFRSSYAAIDEASYRCYGGALVAVTAGDAELIAVGSTDPFRNERIGEVGNAALATGLLTGTGEVVWVDVHRKERSSFQVPPPSAPRYRQPDRTDGSNTLWAAFPPALWAGLLLIGAVGVLVAVARARRLGPPVAEPLPVLVPATEIVTGRGRLYRRASVRTAALHALRSAALRRLAPVLGPVPPGTDAAAFADRDPTALVSRLAARCGLPPADVQAILYPPAPVTDDDLVVAVARLDTLADTVLRTAPRPPDSSPGGVP
ncbi:DUF4350 domain-containing protein [Plantactinospora sp. GCM10030261]|uniref:DUF4350 domain-containing protein n=1 Tax=Plantactinospora sp. GCM10030261 TaxID=3273420 RepID=UPI00360EE005